MLLISILETITFTEEFSLEKQSIDEHKTVFVSSLFSIYLSSAFNVVEVPALQSRIICHHLCFWGFLPAVHLKELLWSRIKQRLSHLFTFFFTEQCSSPLSTVTGESKLGAEQII